MMRLAAGDLLQRELAGSLGSLGVGKGNEGKDMLGALEESRAFGKSAREVTALVEGLGGRRVDGVFDEDVWGCCGGEGWLINQEASAVATKVDLLFSLGEGEALMKTIVESLGTFLKYERRWREGGGQEDDNGEEGGGTRWYLKAFEGVIRTILKGTLTISDQDLVKYHEALYPILVDSVELEGLELRVLVKDNLKRFRMFK